MDHPVVSLLEVPDVRAHVLHLIPLPLGLDDVVRPLLLVGRDEGAVEDGLPRP